MLSKPLSLDEPAALGFPFHGVTRDGVLTLAGGNGTVTFPALVPASGTLSGGIYRGLEPHLSVVRNSNRTLPTRTSEQQTADAALGREYRDHGIRSGRHVNGKPGSTAGNLQAGVYVDSAGYPWSVDLSGLVMDTGADSLAGDVVFRRLFTISTTMQQDTVTVPLSLTPAGLSGAADLGPLGVQFHASGGVVLADQLSGGGQLLLVPRMQLTAAASESSSVEPLDIQSAYPLAVWELGISDTPDQGYPRAGDIAFNLAPSVKRSLASIRADVTFNYQYDRINGQRRYLDTGSVGEYIWFRDADPEGSYTWSWYLTIDVDVTLTLTGRLLSVYYDAAGQYQELSVDIEGTWLADVSSSETGGGSDQADIGSREVTASGSGSYTVSIHRGASTLITRTATYGGSGSESWTYESADVSDSGQVEVDGTSSGNVTLDLDGVYTLDETVSSGFDWAANLTRGALVFMTSDEVGHAIADQLGDTPLSVPVQAVLNFHTAEQSELTEYQTMDLYGHRQFYNFCPCVLSTAHLASLPAWHFDAFRQFDQNNTNILRAWFEVGAVVAPDDTSVNVAAPGPDGDIDFDTTITGHPYYFDGQPALWQPETGQWATAAWLDDRYELLNFV